eukprot:TRINITY_DN16758_c0_g1_i1.p1 TRINITY_DN16758_c0_g1~~TRINITY_DN16758_c0_g1_i1.p1  ORF type:complete len:479 (-),score=109.41 TRINITY_DN16758_c0_g1_i1:5-1441(-)
MSTCPNQMTKQRSFSSPLVLLLSLVLVAHNVIVEHADASVTATDGGGRSLPRVVSVVQHDARGFDWENVTVIPEQIHLAYGDAPSQMNVQWATIGPAVSFVLYGLSPNALDLKSTHANTTHFTYGNPKGAQYVHRVTVMNLTSDTRYYYQAVSNQTKSDVFSFETMKAGNDWIPRFLVFGDMGHLSGEFTMPRLIEEVAKGDGNITAAIHIGDFAYNLNDNGGAWGDDFMHEVQDFAAYVPYMTCVGNHELYFNMSHYINRFFMPNNAQSQNMFYSWNIANIHFIAYSTEVYWAETPGVPYSPEQQYRWLEADLKEANKNRSEQPWIIAYGHRPMYCSNDDGDDCTLNNSTVRLALETLFYENGVDVVIEAHEHSYERLWPTYNYTVTQENYIQPKAPIHIISGAAGCDEQLGACINPILGPRGPWSAFRAWFLAYGYGHLEVHNATHLYWEELLDLGGGVLDHIWIVQDQHGPFPHL